MRVVTAALLFSLALPSNAQVQETQSRQAAFIQMCDRIETIAESIMTGRQNGVGLAEMRRAFLDKSTLEGIDPNTVEFLTQLIDELLIEAFDTPRFSSGQYQESAIRDFADSQFLTCLKTVKGNN